MVSSRVSLPVRQRSRPAAAVDAEETFWNIPRPCSKKCEIRQCHKKHNSTSTREGAADVTVAALFGQLAQGGAQHSPARPTDTPKVAQGTAHIRHPMPFPWAAGHSPRARDARRGRDPEGPTRLGHTPSPRWIRTAALQAGRRQLGRRHRASVTEWRSGSGQGDVGRVLEGEIWCPARHSDHEPERLLPGTFLSFSIQVCLMSTPHPPNPDWPVRRACCRGPGRTPRACTRSRRIWNGILSSG
jgi:hypothetical protein